MNYAGFWIRFVAALLDSVIIVALSVIVATVFAVIKLAVVGSLAQLVLAIGYYVWFQSRTGQTLGKKVMKIKVVNATGATPIAWYFCPAGDFGEISLWFDFGYWLFDGGLGQQKTGLA